MNWKASFLGSYFAHLLHRSLGWLLLAGSLFLLVQCGGGSGEGGSGEGESGTPDLVIVGSKLSSKSAEIGDNLRVTVTIKNQGTGISGGADSLQTVTFYRSGNKFISPRDEILGISSFGTLEPNAQSTQSFNFEARAGDNYYGACLGFTNDCQIGIKLSVPIPDISGSDSYAVCQLTKGDVLASVPSSSKNMVELDMNTNTVAKIIRINQGKITQYLMQIKQKGVLDIWSTGSEDMSALLFDGNCNAISEHYYAEDGGIGGSNNFQISAIAAEGYYFLVIYEKSLKAATFDITAILNYPPRVVGDDPLYPKQWHLNNPNDQEIDINVPQAWDITRGDPKVLVAVLDDGVEVSHPDLAPNHDDRYDNSDPMFHKHGTAVAGLIVAADNNGIGVRGVAPEVRFVSLRVSGVAGLTHSKAVAALVSNKEQTAISNNSWNSYSGGRFALIPATFDVAFEEGITNGYGGKGIFYVFSGGNRYSEGANTNYSSTSNHYAISAICAVGSDGTRATYSEKGASLWLCAPSGDISLGLTTTDIVGTGGYNNAGDYADDFKGTSASAPIVSGVAALMRSANPELGWRDIRLILAATAKKIDGINPGWFEGVASYDGSKSGSARYADTNTKYNHNHEYGFGLVDAQAAVMKSQSWNNVGQMVVISSQSKDIPPAERQVPDGDGLSSVLKVTGLNDTLDFIEYVDIDINMGGKDHGDLQINLTSLANKTSILAEQHNCFNSMMVVIKCVFGQSTKASFGSARHLGESPDGYWTLKVIDGVTGDNNNVYSWGLKFYGHKKP